MRHFHKRFRPAEEDLHSLLWEFTSLVSHGAEPSFATFKDIWAKRHLSWIFLGNNSELSTDKFVQGLYAIMLDCLDIPMADHAHDSRPVSAAAQQQRVHEQAGSFHNPADDQYLHQLMLGDDADNEQPEPRGQTNTRIGTDSHPGAIAADSIAASKGMASYTHIEGRAAEDNPKSKHGLSQPVHTGTTLALVVNAGKAHAEILQAYSGLQAHQVAPGTSKSPLLPPSQESPPPATEAATEADAGAPNIHSLASNPGAIGYASHNGPPTGPSLAGVSLLDALPDAPLRTPPSSGPKGNQPPTPPSDAPIIAKPLQPGSLGAVLQHTLQDEDQQLPATASATVSLQPALELTLPPTQSGEDSGPPSSNLFMTEADLLFDGPSQDLPSAGHDQPLPEGSTMVVSQPTHPVLALSGASLAARAAQRRQNAPAPALILSAAPAAAPAPAAAAAPNRIMHIKAHPYCKPDPARVPLATRVGSLYAIYCLHETQPGRVPVYLPLELLHQLLDVVKEAQATMPCDVVQVVGQLMKKRAFVVGAVRRPPRNSAADEAALGPPNRMAASSLSGMTAKAQKEREALYHIQSMYRGLAMVGPLQDLCRDYKQAKAHSWNVAGVKGKPVGFANLTVGAKLAQLLHQATTKITPKIRRKPAGRPSRSKKRPRSGDGPPHGEGGAQGDIDPELDNLLESSFLEAVSEDEASPAAPGSPAATANGDDEREEGECSDSDKDAPADDDASGMGSMGLGFGMDFADVANDAQHDDAFAETVVPLKLPPAAKKAMERDKARKRRRYLAEKGWDAFQDADIPALTPPSKSRRHTLRVDALLSLVISTSISFADHPGHAAVLVEVTSESNAPNLKSVTPAFAGQGQTMNV